MESHRFSASTSPFIDRPLEEAMGAIAEAGLKKLDLWGRMPHFSVHPAEWDAAHWKERAGSYGVQIANLETFVGPGFVSENTSQQEREWKHLCQLIDCAAFLRARSIRLFDGQSSLQEPDQITRLVPWLQCAARAGELKGIHLAIDSGAGSPEMLHTLVEQVGSPFLGVLFDPSLSQGTDYQAAFARLQHQIVHIRLKIGEMDDPRTPMGPKLEAPWLFCALDRIGYAGDIALEYKGKAIPVEVGLREWIGAPRELR